MHPQHASNTNLGYCRTRSNAACTTCSNIRFTNSSLGRSGDGKTYTSIGVSIWARYSRTGWPKSKLEPETATGDMDGHASMCSKTSRIRTCGVGGPEQCKVPHNHNHNHRTQKTQVQKALVDWATKASTMSICTNRARQQSVGWTVKKVKWRHRRCE